MKASVDAFVEVSRSLREQRRFVEARASLVEGLRLHPRDVRLLVELVLLDNAKDGQLSDGIEAQSRKPDMLPVEIIVCVHNALDDTKQCLKSIISRTTLPYRLTIVDDASRPEVGDYLASFVAAHEHARVLSNKTNIGYTRSANRGIEAAESRWVVLLNSDAIVTTDWLEGLLDCACSDEEIGGVGPFSNAASLQTLDAVQFLPEQAAPEIMAALLKRISQKRYPRLPFLSGFCALLSTVALKEVGSLDVVNFSGYGVDGNMSLALVNAGYKLAVADDVYVHHLGAASFGKGEQRDRMIAEGREKLKELWPGYDFRLIKQAADLQLNGTKRDVQQELYASAKKKRPRRFVTGLFRRLVTSLMRVTSKQ